MTGMELALVVRVVTVASCLQGAIGFGLGLLAAPVVALFDPCREQSQRRFSSAV